MAKTSISFSNCYLFSLLNDKETEIAISHLSPRRVKYRTGDIVFSSTSHIPCLCFIEAGAVTVSRCEGGNTVLLSQLSAGDCVGAASLFGAGNSYPTTVQASCPLTLLIVEEKDLESLLSINHKVALAHIRYLSDKIRFLNDKIDSLSGRSSESKLAKYLLCYMDEDGIFRPRFSMTKIAASLDISRASLYRLLDQMEQSGLIENVSGMIKILNKNAIERMANQK